MKVTALAGGVGGAKLAVGLQRVLEDSARGDLTVVVNTADDDVVYGVHVSPDVDIVTYWLAGIADFERGWGIAGDTFVIVDALERLGGPSWFRLGDRDFGTCVYRTERLDDGATLTTITDEIRRSLGVPSWILPMTDDPVRSRVHLTDGRELSFQEYFVRERHAPEIAGVELAGRADAKPAPGVIDAIAAADRVVICPSNPIVSIGPILELPGVRDTLQDHPRVAAVSPIVAGAALKGPADRMLDAYRIDVSAAGVASLYSDLCDVFVFDEADASLAPEIAALGMETLVVDTVMHDHDKARVLAEAILQ